MAAIGDISPEKAPLSQVHHPHVRRLRAFSAKASCAGQKPNKLFKLPLQKEFPNNYTQTIHVYLGGHK